MNYLLIYLLVINASGFLLMRADKKRAIQNRWRIQENTLILIAIIGGSIGTIIGMQSFHHKTKHPKFYIGLPLILSAQIIGSILFALHIN